MFETASTHATVPPPPVNQALLSQEPSVAMAHTACPVSDPGVELMDGSRTVEVTALFGDTVLQVRHLSGRENATIRPLTYGVAGASLAACIAGGILALMGQLGLASVLLTLGVGAGVLARSRMEAERRSPHYSLGEASEADLHVAGSMVPEACFPLVEAEQGQHLLNFTQGMQGDVTVGADRVPLELLVRSGHASSTHRPGCYSFPIPRDARIKVDVGDNTFLIHSVAPPRQLAGSMLGQVDWSRQTFNGVSFGVHAVVLLMVFLVPPDSRALSLDTFNIDNQRVSTRLVPVVMPEDTMDRLLRQKTKPEPAGKPGALFKGPAGKAGNRNSKQHNRRVAVVGKDEGLKPARELAEEAARKAGVLGLLGGKTGARFASLFSDSEHALGNDTVEALGNLIGDQTGEAYGIGGVGIAGTMRGGGGDNSGEYVGTGGPLGTVGRGGNDPNGRYYGLRQGKLKDHKTGTPEPKGVVKVKGALSKEIIRRVVRRHLNQVRYCYQQELQSSPDLYGRVMVRFAIVGTGQVATSVVESSTLANHTVETCITQAVRRWLFPKPEGGGTVVVSYPFVLRAAGQ